MNKVDTNIWKELASNIVELIERNKGLKIFLDQRAAFENWLQVEIVGYLANKGDSGIKVECKYEGCETYADIKTLERGCIELKIFYNTFSKATLDTLNKRKHDHAIIFLFKGNNSSKKLLEEEMFDEIYSKPDLCHVYYAGKKNF